MDRADRAWTPKHSCYPSWYRYSELVREENESQSSSNFSFLLEKQSHRQICRGERREGKRAHSEELKKGIKKIICCSEGSFWVYYL